MATFFPASTEAFHTRKLGAVSIAGRLRWWHICFLAGVVVVFSAVKYVEKPEVVDVRTASPTYGDIESSVSTLGRVVPVGEFQARANFSGIVQEIYVHLGDKVHPGQMLVKMKDPFASSRVAAASAALESAEVNSENVQRNGSQEDRIAFAADYKRAHLEQVSAQHALAAMKQLDQDGSASEAELVAANQRLQAADATLQALDERSKARYSAKDVASWKARVAEAQASLNAEKITFANANISSPISGTVYLLPVSRYDFVPMGADLLRVADLSRIEVRANFDEPDIGKLAAGQPVAIRWDGEPEHVWHGHIDHPPMAVKASGPRSVGECTIMVDDAKGLPANTNVNVTVTTKKHTHVLTIPREALHTDGPANFAYRIVDGKLRKTPIELGVVSLAGAEISKGLTPGDVIALHALNNQELKDDLAIRQVK